MYPATPNISKETKNGVKISKIAGLAFDKLKQQEMVRTAAAK